MKQPAWLEQRSIEFVPERERYGGPGRLFSIWFSINLSIVCLTVGTLGVGAGLPLLWALLALALGNAAGTALMAAHSAQGPHLGIPQMIQCRAQFGVLGAALPLAAVVTTYTLYTAADGVVIRDTLKHLLPVGDDGALVLFGAATLVIAFAGYEAIHRLGKILAVVSALLFLWVFVLLRHPAAPTPSLGAAVGQFTAAAFLLTVTQAAAWSLSFGPYVADYSRYLPASVSAKSTFWCTAAGNFVGSTLMMGLGAYLSATRPDLAHDPGTGIAALFGSGGYVVRVLLVIGVLEGNVMNLYSAYMSSATIFTGVRGMKTVQSGRKFLGMTVLAAVATLIAMITQYDFDVYFSDMLSAMVYILVPWSAINLTDYYAVRRGRYDIAELYELDGSYGRINWTGCGVYLLGVLVQVPFATLSFHTGVLARAIGADVAWLPGSVIPAAVYWMVARKTCRDRTSH